MKKVDIFCWASGDGKFLSIGDCFEEALLKEFETLSDFFKKEKWYIVLSEHLKTKGSLHAQDFFGEKFREKISLDFKFAKGLNLFDIVDAECFTADGELGMAIIQLCVMSDMRFIVSRKYYLTKETVKIDFEVCHTDSDYECHKALITQTLEN